MAEITVAAIEPIRDLLARKGYGVSEAGGNALEIQDVETGVSIRTVLEGEILFFSLLCMTAPEKKLTAPVMRKMLGAENGIATSYFQLYESSKDEIAVTLNNFCKLQGLGTDDEDDILSCVSFLLADVIHAKQLIGADLAS